MEHFLNWLPSSETTLAWQKLSRTPIWMKNEEKQESQSILSNSFFIKYQPLVSEANVLPGFCLPTRWMWLLRQHQRVVNSLWFGLTWGSGAYCARHWWCWRGQSERALNCPHGVYGLPQWGLQQEVPAVNRVGIYFVFTAVSSAARAAPVTL